MERRLSQGEAGPYRGRRRSLADIKINLFPAQRTHGHESHPSTARSLISAPTAVPERRHSFGEKSPTQSTDPKPDTNVPIQSSAMGRRRSIAVDDVTMLKRGTSHEANAERRKSLIENAMIFHNTGNLSVNNLRRPRRASCSHILPMKAACSNAERVSDSVSTARKLLSEIDKQRKLEHTSIAAKHQMTHLEVPCLDPLPCKEEESDNSGNLPPAWYEFKANMLKNMKTDKLLDVNRNTILTPLTRGRRNSDTVLPVIRVQPIDTPDTEIGNTLENANHSSRCPSSLKTDTWNYDSRSHEQHQSTFRRSSCTKFPPVRNRSVESSRQRDDTDSDQQETAATSWTVENSPNSNLSYKESGHMLRRSSKSYVCITSGSSTCTCQNDKCPARFSQTCSSTTRQNHSSPTRSLKTSPSRTEERIKHRHAHTVKLQKLLKAMEEEMPTQAQLQLKQLREEYNKSHPPY